MKYDGMVEIATFTATNTKVINGEVYFDSLYTSPKRANGTELDPHSIGVSKINPVTGKESVILKPSATQDYSVMTSINEDGSIKK
jgi:hypothetical protein